MPGSNAVVMVSGLSAANVRVSAMLNDTQVTVFSAGNGRILLQVPSTVSQGWALLKLSVEGETVNSVLVPVSGAAPSIQYIEGADQLLIDSNRPAYSGDNLTLTVIDPSQGTDSAIRANEVAISIGETPVYTLRVNRSGPGLFQTTILTPRGLSDGTYPLTITVNGRTSSPISLPLRNR